MSERKKCPAPTKSGVCTKSATCGRYCKIHHEKYDENVPLPPVGSKEYNNRLVIKFPEIAKEWDYEKNKGLNINGFSYASDHKVWWICPKTSHSYKTRIANRTMLGHGCRECSIDSIRVHDKEDVENLRNNPSSVDLVSIGDDSEEYIVNLLKSSKEYKSVEKIGQIGGNADILITHYDETFNYIQVKTLSVTTSKEGKQPVDTYHFFNKSEYPEDMLIVMVNKERTRFGVDFFGNIPPSGITLRFCSTRSKYLDIMFTDEDEFLERLIDSIPQSSSENSISAKTLMENEMYLRFQTFCASKGIHLVRNTTNGNSIDCFINGYPAQLKYTTDKTSQYRYNVNSTKCAGTLNGKGIRKNYTVGDFDFFIIEVGGTEDESGKYHGNFCIIPKRTLISENILKSDTCKGKGSFKICPPDFELYYHWAKHFWNNTEVIPKMRLKLVIVKK